MTDIFQTISMVATIFLAVYVFFFPILLVFLTLRQKKWDLLYAQWMLYGYASSSQDIHIPQDYKRNVMLNSAEHKLYTVHRYQIRIKGGFMLNSTEHEICTTHTCFFGNFKNIYE